MSLFTVSVFVLVSFMTAEGNSPCQGDVCVADALGREDFHTSLRELPENQLGHVCFTGNRAVPLVRDKLLMSWQDPEEINLISRLNPANKCKLYQFAAGRVLFTMIPEIKDNCIAHFKVQPLTCDIIVHAQGGKKCDQLYKSRWISDQPTAQLVLVDVSETIQKCYQKRLQESSLPSETIALMSLDAVPRFDFSSVHQDAAGQLRANLRAALEGKRPRVVDATLGVGGLVSNATQLRRVLSSSVLASSARSSAAPVDVTVELLQHLEAEEDGEDWQEKSVW